MIRNRRSRMKNVLTRSIVAALVSVLSASVVLAAPSNKALSDKKDGAETKSDTTADEDRYFDDIYQRFYDSYRLGPDDQIAVRVLGHEDYTLDRVQISPAGAIYHPLIGEIRVAGLTKMQLERRLTSDLSEYVLHPKVTISLLEARSAKIGVLGEVVNPGVIVMNRPMTVVDAIASAGGITDFGDRSNVQVHRNRGDGVYQKVPVNLKAILDGKATPEQNILLKAGDAVLVHGNKKKAINQIASYLSFASFLTFISATRGSSR